MKTRYWNRREFDVTPNGYFTVLKSSGWFSAARLPAGFRYLFNDPNKPAKPGPLLQDGQAIGLPPQILAPSTSHSSLIRLVLIALSAIGITIFAIWLLWFFQ